MATTMTRKTQTGTNSIARVGNILLGAWLFLSAFIWFHTSSQFTNTWLVGAGIAAVAAIGLAAPQIRWVNALLAAWLVLSVFVMPTYGATFWNNLIVGVLSFVVALMPFMTTERKRHYRTPHRAHPSRI